MVNVVSKLCPCGKQTSFGEPGKKSTACAKCKTKEMVEINGLCPCGTHACFGMPGTTKTLACTNCKTEEMVDIRNKRCNANGKGIYCPQQGNRNYDGFCTHCFANLFPCHPKTVTIRTKSKELKVVSHLVANDKAWICDKPLFVDLNGGCCPSKRRIDLRKLIGNTMLCVEIDEGQHKDRIYVKEEKEGTRYNDLFMDFSGKYIFIRYNPDMYTDGSGKKKNPHFATRMAALEKELEAQLQRINEGKNSELLEIIHLFYDEE